MTSQPRDPRVSVRNREETEEPLVGGTANRGLVVRVGDTVRRPQRRESASTHALLRHLQSVGFSGAPRFLGLDQRDREVLSYIDGVAALSPYPSWSLSDDALSSVATLMRDYHDATTGFRAEGLSWTTPVIAAWRSGDVVCHNDLNLDNVVFRDGRAAGLIDFDLSSPGSRVWDVAGAVRLWAPLRAEHDIDDARAGRALVRARVFLDAYGLGRRDRQVFAEAVLASHDWCYAIVRNGAVTGHTHFANYWHQGGADRATRSRDWILAHQRALRRIASD